MDDADRLLAQLLDDGTASTTVSVPVTELPLLGTCTILFSATPATSAMRTFVCAGRPRPGEHVRAEQLLGLPVELDLTDTASAQDARRCYTEQARELAAALQAGATMLALWAQLLAEQGASRLSHRLPPSSPMPRWQFLPGLVDAPDSQLSVGVVCAPRRLAEGRPALGLALAQGDVRHQYPLHVDPDDALDDFRQRVAVHATALADTLSARTQTIDRFTELFVD